MKRHYTKAPIREAVVEIRVKPKPEMTVEEMVAAFEREGEFIVDFPERQDIYSESFTFTPADLTPPSAREKIVHGYRYISLDKRCIFQARPEMMAFSIICEPETENRYKRWEDFLPLVKKAWMAYCNATEPLEINRAGIRYINRFVISQRNYKAEDYFTIHPTQLNPEYLSHRSVVAFHQGLIVPQPDIQAIAILNILSPAGETEDGSIEVTLDIDLFCDDLALAVREQTSLWDIIIERLHLRRNDVFEACITDKVRELII